MSTGTRGIAVAAIVAAVLSGGCSRQPSATATTSTTESPSFGDFGSGSAGYEMETLSTGVLPRVSLIVPAPVGAEQSLVATIETTSTGQPTWVSAELRVVVQRSRADGSSDTLSITATEFSASDAEMAEALQGWLGATATVVRGQNRVVEMLSWEQPTEQESTDGAQPYAERVEFWVEQLLGAPVSFVRPLPTEALGLDATWASTTIDGNGVETKAQHQLTEIEADRYVVEFSSSSSASTWGGLIEGTRGAPVPAHQEIDLGTTTILVTPAVAAG